MSTSASPPHQLPVWMLALLVVHSTAGIVAYHNWIRQFWNDATNFMVTQQQTENLQVDPTTVLLELGFKSLFLIITIGMIILNAIWLPLHIWDLYLSRQSSQQHRPPNNHDQPQATANAKSLEAMIFPWLVLETTHYLFMTSLSLLEVMRYLGNIALLCCGHRYLIRQGYIRRNAKLHLRKFIFVSCMMLPKLVFVLLREVRLAATSSSHHLIDILQRFLMCFPIGWTFLSCAIHPSWRPFWVLCQRNLRQLLHLQYTRGITLENVIRQASFAIVFVTLAQKEFQVVSLLRDAVLCLLYSFGVVLAQERWTLYREAQRTRYPHRPVHDDANHNNNRNNSHLHGGFIPETNDANIPSVLQCFFCLEKERSYRFHPCGHVLCCEDCIQPYSSSLITRHGTSTYNCPICRQVLTNVHRLHFS